MQWEMLSHFIILSNKWVQEVIRQMAPQLAQGKWWNNLRMTRMASLRGCCCCAAIAARKKMMIWGCSPPRKKLKLWIRALLKKPRKTQKDFLEWPTLEYHPLGVLRSCSKTLMKLLLKCWWNCCWNAYESTAGMPMEIPHLSRHMMSPGLRVRSSNRDTQCTKQCCWLAKQPVCSKSKWLSQKLITRMIKMRGFLSIL